jgi:hypothetical protein
MLKNNSLNYGVNLDWTFLMALKCSQIRAAEGIAKNRVNL